ncbi:DUF2244 domain-containing protein [Thalassococcus sp. CAU 1522]|uniref:DUF2244 domain-containing protein n=1 Tax=Thalassococcus arenae TaxID=2851652 RepID=A0ABS6N2L0_9RHOB|nr:DUF2244 domain-containing protein [Thalassococcus arenae]MBV2358252.1 DUF2244 domain-containing protein [Thalassococcus arenae]
MPYRWTETSASPDLTLTLWPHNALPARGFAATVLGFFCLASIPLYGLLGTVLLWGVLPFMLMATAGLYYALRRNEHDRQIVEVLTLSPDRTHLVRTNPGGNVQDWDSNTYWVRVAMHEAGGPVPFYVTLKGNGREVEIGAFLSEDERKALFDDLSDRLARLTRN